MGTITQGSNGLTFIPLPFQGYLARGCPGSVCLWAALGDAEAPEAAPSSVKHHKKKCPSSQCSVAPQARSYPLL